MTDTRLKMLTEFAKRYSALRPYIFVTRNGIGIVSPDVTCKPDESIDAVLDRLIEKQDR